MGSLLVALGLVVVAELGDKTQLVALGMGARHQLRPVLLGVAMAYAASNLLSVIGGGLLGAGTADPRLGHRRWSPVPRFRCVEPAQHG